MHKIHLNGADAEAVAEIMGGVLIMVNETDDIATISGGDPGGTPRRGRIDGPRRARKRSAFSVSATNYYDLADNIENTTDEELERIIAAGGDESKEGAA